MADLTIIYLTAGKLEPRIREVCLRKLYEAAGDHPVIERHQPADWPFSGLSMYRNIYAGLEDVKTKYVAIAEHDCIYSPEHFQFRPPDDKYFWYNTNCYLLQYKNDKHPEYDGMFSIFRDRKVQSQLICTADMLRQVTKVQIEIVSRPDWNSIRNNMPVGEPGTLLYEHAKKLTRKNMSMRMVLRDFLNEFQARTFSTAIPNIDIRHGDNFTGQRRGKERTFSLEPWGTMNDLFNA